jgi:L-lactate dehydrogenase complex protein LldF
MRRKCNERTATELRPGQRIQARARRRRSPIPICAELSWRDGFPDRQARGAVPDADLLERQRGLAEHIRKYSLARLPELLEQLERKLTENGVQVHWAENPARRTGSSSTSPAAIRPS